MRQSEFQRAMAEEFGETYSGVLVRDHWITSLQGTAADSLARGISPREIWKNLCEDLDVPIERRHGRGLMDPQQ